MSNMYPDINSNTVTIPEPISICFHNSLCQLINSLIKPINMKAIADTINIDIPKNAVFGVHIKGTSMINTDPTSTKTYICHSAKLFTSIFGIAPQLNPEDQYIIDHYKSLTPHDREIVDHILNMKPEEPTIIYRFPVYEQQAAAGAGITGRDGKFTMQNIMAK